jgi:hypothetical protein
MVLQHVHDRIQFFLEEQDFSALLEPERRVQADAFAAQMCQTAFDLAVPPHFRVALLRLAEEEHLLVILFHHAIIDGSSMGPFFVELASLYDAGRRGKSAVLPDLAFQYTEFAERQKRLEVQAGFDRDIAFWKKTLADAPPLLALPFRRSGPPRQASRVRNRQASHQGIEHLVLPPGRHSFHGASLGVSSAAATLGRY